MKLVASLTREDKAEFIRQLRKGLDPGAAARRVGSTGIQFRKLRSPLSQHFDIDFALACEKALKSRTARKRRKRRLGL